MAVVWGAPLAGFLAGDLLAAVAGDLALLGAGAGVDELGEPRGEMRGEPLL